MAEVAFHTGLADKPGYACRMLRKAWRLGSRVVVRGSGEQLARLDTLLWTFEPLEFVPHARLRAGQRVEPAMARTPIWLVDDGVDAPEATVLVNLGPAFAADHARYDKVIELVSDDDTDRTEARRRWRQFEAAGQAVTHHARESAA